MAKLPYDPTQSGYVLTYGQEVVAVKLDGGASRMRRDIIGAWHELDVSWRLKKDEYAALMTFFETNAAIEFEADLIVDGNAAAEHKCRLLPGTLQLRRLSRPFFVVSARFEVKPESV